MTSLALLFALTVLGVAAVTAIAAVTAVYLRRASHGRQALGEEIHDRALGLDRRCDFLGDVLFAVKERHEVLIRIDHLFDLVACGESARRLGPAAAAALRRYVVDLRSEALGALPDPDHPDQPRAI